MKQIGKKIGTVLRIVLGVGILAYILYRVDISTHCVDFQLVQTGSAAEDAVYADKADPSQLFIVLESGENQSMLKTVQKKGTPDRLAVEGTLSLVSGSGPPTLDWNSWTISKSGLRYVADIIRGSFRRWPWLAAGFLLCSAGILGTVVRWRLVLKTQDASISLGKALMISSVGLFFSTLMPGSTGGDVVKAYYISREAGARKTEIFSSVFIDRMLGLLPMLLLTAVAMTCRHSLILSHAFSRAVYLLVICLTVAFAGFLFLLFRHNLFERWTLFARLEHATAVGPVLRKAYEAFRICWHHPTLLPKGFVISILGQSMSTVGAFCFARGLGAAVSFFDFFALFPAVMIIAAIPTTPGSLGVREAATVLLMSAAGIPSARSLPLSLLVYLTHLAWGLLGGAVFVINPPRPVSGQVEATRDPAHP